LLAFAFATTLHSQTYKLLLIKAYQKCRKMLIDKYRKNPLFFKSPHQKL
jgi:hypothetical protein